MKKVNLQPKCSTLEHLSFTLTQINQDATGKQTVNRTYWSTRKKVNELNNNTDELMSRDPLMGEKKTQRDTKKEESQVKRFVQMSLFQD